MKQGIESLLVDTSRKVADQVCGIVIKKPEIIEELMEHSLQQKGNMALRASNVLALVSESNPELVAPYLERIIRSFPELKHVSVKRGFTRIVSHYTDITDDDLLSIMVNHCFEWLNDPDETIAIRAYSMTILANVCKIYPELIPELRETIELHYNDGSAGFKTRAMETLKRL